MNIVSNKNLTAKYLISDNGATHLADRNSLKMQLRAGMGLSNAQFSKKLLGLIHDKEQPVQNRVLAIQNLPRIWSNEAEKLLVRLVSRKDTRLSFAALKALSFKGTEKAYKALSSTERLSYELLERQKDFAQLMIGYRLNLPGTGKILRRLLKNVPAGKELKEFHLVFRLMTPREISTVLERAGNSKSGITLSRKLAFRIKTEKRSLYFCFNKEAEDFTAWTDTLKTKRVFGQLLRKELHSDHISQRYVALCTPKEDYSQISVFRRNGELLMLANMRYSSEQNTFVFSNADSKRGRASESSSLRLGRKTFATMDLSSVRIRKKRSATSS